MRARRDGRRSHSVTWLEGWLFNFSEKPVIKYRQKAWHDLNRAPTWQSSLGKLLMTSGQQNEAAVQEPDAPRSIVECPCVQTAQRKGQACKMQDLTNSAFGDLCRWRGICITTIGRNNRKVRVCRLAFPGNWCASRRLPWYKINFRAIRDIRSSGYLDYAGSQNIYVIDIIRVARKAITV